MKRKDLLAVVKIISPTDTPLFTLMFRNVKPWKPWHSYPLKKRRPRRLSRKAGSRCEL